MPKRRTVSVAALTSVCMLTGCKDEQRGAADLVIITPHDERIHRAFGDGLNAARAKAGKPPVKIEWNLMATNDAVKFITGEFAAAHKKGPDAGIHYDVFFGGGRPAFDKLRKEGCLQPAQVSEGVLAGIPKTLAGVPLYDPERHWFGSVLAAFGIIYNKDGLREKGLPEPKTWADMADPKLRGWVALADPGKSGSVSVCYEMILQTRGWAEGWGLIMRLAGNARDLLPTSRNVPEAVTQGSALLGPCLDYYGYTEVDAKGAEHIGFVAPLGATAITPDPMAVLKNAPHAALANEFVEFVLSPAGQALWALPSGHPDGPQGKPLYRLPIRPDTYETYAGQLLLKDNPFALQAGFEFDPKQEEQRATLLGPLFNAAFLRQKDLMQRAWQAVIAKGLDPALLAEFERAPFGEDEGFALAREYADPRRATELDGQWSGFFRKKYERVLDMGQ